MGSLGMLFYVIECFPVNLENLAANAVGSAQLCRVNEQVQGDGGLVAVALGKAAHEVHEVGALDAQGAQVGDGLPQVSCLVSYGLLEVSEGVDLVGSCGGDLAPEDIQLDFDAEQRLQNAIVQVASDAAALGFNGASS